MLMDDAWSDRCDQPLVLKKLRYYDPSQVPVYQHLQVPNMTSTEGSLSLYADNKQVVFLQKISCKNKDIWKLVVGNKIKLNWK